MRDNLINYKVYLAGQYAPTSEVIVQSVEGGFPEAKITLFPHPLMANFGENDRVPCQIFFLDTFSEPPYEYKLMLDGEVTAVEYLRTSNSISMALSVVSYYAILSQMFRINFTSIVDQTVDAGQNIAPSTSDTSISALVGQDIMSNRADAIPDTAKLEDLFSKKYYLADGVTPNPEAPKESLTANNPMRRPYVMLRNLLIEYLNGASQKTDTVNDVSLFFKAFVSKKDIIRTLFASPLLENRTSLTGGESSPTANILLSAIIDANFVNTVVTGLSAFLNSMGQNKSISYWEILRTMYNVMMYEMLLPTCPPYVSADIFGVPADGSAISGPLDFLSKPNILFGHAPLCNTIFPCMFSSVAVNNQHLTKPTRFYLQNPDSIVRLQQSQVMNKIFLNYSSTTYPTEIKLDDKGNPNLDPNSYRKKLLWDSEGKYNEFFKGPVTLSSSEAPEWINWVKKATSQPPKGLTDETKSAVEKAQLSTSSSLNKVLDLYAQNEFEKEVASRHTLNIELKFNPFLIAGFPVAIVDNVHYKTYYMGIAKQITHRLSTSGASTSLLVTNVVPFGDAYYKKKEQGYTIGPTNASSQVAFIFNRSCNSTAYYKFLLYQGAARREYIFNPKTYFNMTDEGEISTVLDQDKSTRKPGVLDSAIDYVTDYNEALKLVSRPITTLAQYLKHKKSHIASDTQGNAFWYNTTQGVPHGGTTSIGSPIMFNGSPPDNAVKKMATKGSNTSQEKVPYEGVPVYYDQILGFTYLHQVDETGARLFTAKPKTILDYPDFYEDWASKVAQYRKDVLNFKKDFFIG